MEDEIIINRGAHGGLRCSVPLQIGTMAPCVAYQQKFQPGNYLHKQLELSTGWNFRSVGYTVQTSKKNS